MNTQENPEESVLIWEAPKIVKPEFRLYYDDKGHVVCYTCDKLDGNYIVIDATTFAEGRPDIRVIDGKITNVQEGTFVSKLVPSDVLEKLKLVQFDYTEGVNCAEEDVSIVVDKNYKGKKTNWKMATYELR